MDTQYEQSRQKVERSLSILLVTLRAQVSGSGEGAIGRGFVALLFGPDMKKANLSGVPTAQSFYAWCYANGLEAEYDEVGDRFIVREVTLL